MDHLQSDPWSRRVSKEIEHLVNLASLGPAGRNRVPRRILRLDAGVASLAHEARFDAHLVKPVAVAQLQAMLRDM